MSIKRIPPEIISDIFLECVSRHYYESYSFRRLLHITHVCHVWREIAISDGRLWSYLHANYSLLDRTRDPKAIFDVFLARTSGALLHFQLAFDFKIGPSGKEGAELAVYMINTLVSQQHRWRVFSLDMRGSPCFPILDLTNMPMLTTLYLSCRGNTKAFIDIGRSPKLKRVEIRGDFEIVASKSPLLQLTLPSALIFRLGCLEKSAIRSCLDFLEATPLLQEIHINFEGFPSAPDTLRSEKRLCLPRLRYLRLRNHTGPELLLDNVTLPSLMALELMESRHGRPLVSFFQRSSPPLTFLHLDFADIRENTVIKILCLLPTLQEFRYERASVSARFFQELTITVSATGSTRVVCSALETLFLSHKIQFLEDRRTCIDAFISMLQSRAQISDSFKRVYFWYGGIELDVNCLRDTSDWHEHLEQFGFFVSRMHELPRWTPFLHIRVSV